MIKKTPMQTRKQNRLKDIDYSSCETCFLTICTKDKKTLLGNISVGTPIGRPICILSDYGKIVDKAINNIESKYNRVQLDNYVIMPDHIHLLLTILADENGRPMGAPTIPNIINQLKGYVSKEIGFSVWQKLYYDHIIRDQKDYDSKWQYIDNNPGTWREKHDK